jgi:hypothetical protein
VADTLLDPAAYWSTFANTRAVEPRGRGPHGEVLVTLEQGLSFATGRYTAHVLEAGPTRVVAWIDPIRNVRDGRVEFELTPLAADRCQLDMFVAADLGNNLFVLLFRQEIEGALLMTPELVRNYVEDR